MHVRVRLFGKPDTIVVVESKLTKIERFRRLIKDKFDVDPKLQRLLYGGKLLDDGYTFHDYNIKLNDVIQLMVLQEPPPLEKLKENADEKTKDKSSDSKDANEVIYTDAESALHAIGDLVDMRDSEQGAWFEGKIVRIVRDPKAPTQAKVETSNGNRDTEEGSDSENKPPSDATNSKNTSKPKKKGIAEYFSKTPKKKQDQKEIKQDTACDKGTKDMHLLYKVQLDSDDENTCHYCKLRDIRPRARTVTEIKDLKIGQKVMINHNTESTFEKGYWYDFKVEEIKKLRTTHDLIGTLYLGPEAIPQNDTKVRVHDKIFAIEEVVPLADRSPELKKLMVTQPDKRSLPLNCLTCRDDEDSPCKDCGCFLCAGKDFPDKIVLCDECNNGYHMICLTPPLLVLPEDDWYCPSCARDASTVVAPGAARQQRKTPAARSTRDWGRGMACVGKTKSCSMPPNHFGPIPGIEVGMCWRFRIQLSESGVHRPPVSGIHGRDYEGAYSIVLSGGYEDDVDHGDEFTYTGSGGRDLSGNKRTAEQSCDQSLARENKALARNCAVKRVSEEGGDAGDAWRQGRPVRVVRSYKMLKHFPKYAPREGIRYDGIYKVVKYYPERGLAGFRVWKYLLRRDDPAPPPWASGSNNFPINYPDGFLEAQAQKRALKKAKKGKGTKGKGVKGVKGAKGAKVAKGAKGAKVAKGAKGAKVAKGAKGGKGAKGTKGLKGVKGRKKRSLTDTSSSSEDASPPSKRRKREASPKGSDAETNNQSFDEANLQTTETKGLKDEEKQVILADVQNCKLWKECILVAETRGRKEFVEYVAQMFLCIICQEVAAGPVTTACAHNFCGACLKLAFKSTGGAACPCCRRTPSLPAPNERLRAALRAVMPGYDSGRH